MLHLFHLASKDCVQFLSGRSFAHLAAHVSVESLRAFLCDLRLFVRWASSELRALLTSFIFLWPFLHIIDVLHELLLRLIAHLTLVYDLLILLRKLVHAMTVIVARWDDFHWRHKSYLRLLIHHLYFYLLWLNKTWSGIMLRWNGAIGPLLLLDRRYLFPSESNFRFFRWSLLLTASSTLPSFNRRSCGFTLNDNHVVLHWTRTGFKVVIRGIFENPLLTLYYLFDRRNG